MQKTPNKLGFTLVELIVVITILAILGTIGFLSLQWYSAGARDGNRISTLKSASSGLEYYETQSGKYPIPEAVTATGMIGTSEVSYVWSIKERLASLINISEPPVDPKTQTSFPYGVTWNQRSYQIATTLEDGSQITMNNPLIETAHAASNATARVSGNYPGLLTFSSGGQLWVANVPSLIFAFNANPSNNLLDPDKTIYTTNKSTNIAYSIDTEVAPPSKTGNQILSELTGTSSTLTAQQIPSLASDFTATHSGTLSTALGYSAPAIGITVYGTKYLTGQAVAVGGSGTGETNNTPTPPSVFSSGSCSMLANIYLDWGNSNPLNGVFIGSTLYFTANNGINGIELWKSDGTAGGTMMVKDIYIGNSNSSIAFLTKVNNTLYFRATNGTDGIELWKSDGTEGGTEMVKNINPSGDANLSSLTTVNGVLYLAATDWTNGVELWKSDGTEAGTVMVKNIHPTGNSSPAQLTDVNWVLYFVADNGSVGGELWKSDGTEGGTVMVKNINSTGSFWSNPTNFINVNGVLFFSADDGANGMELWKSDGTEGGTVMVKKISAEFASANPAMFANVNGLLYFRATSEAAGTELWKSDGTEAGTVMVKDINSGTAASNLGAIKIINWLLLFIADNGVNGTELWKSDGTEAGTVMVKDINSAAGMGAWIYSQFIVGNTLYFSANDGSTGGELWKSDGTEAGTVMVRDINPGSIGASLTIFGSMNNAMYFRATDWVNGTELWKCQ